MLDLIFIMQSIHTCSHPERFQQMLDSNYRDFRRIAVIRKIQQVDRIGMFKKASRAPEPSAIANDSYIDSLSTSPVFVFSPHDHLDHTLLRSPIHCMALEPPLTNRFAKG